MVSHDDRMMNISDCIIKISGNQIEYLSKKKKETITKKKMRHLIIDAHFFSSCLK